MQQLAEYKKLVFERKNIVLDYCIKNKNKEIVIITAGNQARGLIRYLRHHKITISYCVDNDPLKKNTFIEGHVVRSFEYLIKNKKNVRAIITSHSYNELILQCQNNNFFEYIISDIDFSFYSHSEIDSTVSLLSSNISKINDVYSMFNDEFSQYTFNNKIKYLITHNTSYLTPIIRPSKYQYFEPSIYKILREDHVIDCGAYDGDTMDECFFLTDGHISHYYAFEPDPKNYSDLLIPFHEPNLHIYNYGVYSKSGWIKFSERNNASSKIDKIGNSEIYAVSIDSFFKKEKVTFIKMDIEGSEKEALLGARKTIKKQKPTLAISVYHSIKDLWEIPLLIKSMGVNYKYYLRHYKNDFADTVLYAVKEKNGNR